ncbi:MAG: carbohydrate binding domain-containing protein [Clostridia bacterium]|nr:carbohydrate binding domain-containing protein [Clostridia bacterium]
MKLNMRKVLALLITVAMVCVAFPMNGLISASAASDALVNGDFEQGPENALPTGWTAENTSKQFGIATKDAVHSGTYASRLGYRYYGMVLYQNVAVEPNTDYTVTFWYKSTKNSEAADYYFGVYTEGSKYNSAAPDKAGQLINSEAGEAVLEMEMVDWTQVTYTFNSGANTAVCLGFSGRQQSSNFNATDAAAYMYVDDILLESGGELPDQPEQPDDSEIVVYDDFEAAEVNTMGDWIDEGVINAKVVGNAGKDASKGLTISGGTANGNIRVYFDVEPNTEYELQYDFFASVDRGAIAVSVRKADKSTVFYQGNVSYTGGQWETHTVTFHSGDNTRMRLLLILVGASENLDAAFDNFIIRKKTQSDDEEKPMENPGFETGDLTGWEDIYSESQVVSTDSYEGQYALHLKGSQWSAVRQTLMLKKDTEYTITFYVKRVTGSDSMGIWIKSGDNNLQDPEGKELGGNYHVTTEDGWKKIEHTFNSYERTRIDLLLGINADGNEVLIDNVSYEAQEATVYVPPLQLFSFSMVTNRPSKPEYNLIQNGGFESTTDAPWNKNTFLGDTVQVVEMDSAPEGNKVLSFNTSGTKTPTWHYFWMDVEPQTDYTFSAWVMGEFLSKDNVGRATFGVIDPDTKNFLVYPEQENKQSKTTLQLFPTSWSFEWNIRSVAFNSGDKTRVGIAVYGYGSRMYLDDIALYESSNGIKYTHPSNTHIISADVEADTLTCAAEDNLLENFDLSAGDTFWKDGLGWKNGFVSVEESAYGYGNSLKYTESDNAVGVCYIRWIDVTPHTEYIFSCDLSVLKTGAGYLALLDDRMDQPLTFVQYDFDQDMYENEWNKVFIHFNPGVYDKIAIMIADQGGEALIDNLRLFEADKAADVEDPFVKMPDGWYKEDGKWVYYQDGYKLANKWVMDSVGWCYVGADGYCVTNKWVADSKGWCYLDDNGRMVTNKWVMDSVGWCYVGADGYCVTNKWVADSKGWCYLDDNGRMVTNKWVMDSVGWCYVGADGYCVTNKWVADSKGWCYLNGSGRMVTNKWVKDSVGWCYVGENGYCVTDKWVADSKGWCYLDANGRMVYNTWIGGDYVGADGYWVPGK